MTERERSCRTEEEVRKTAEREVALLAEALTARYWPAVAEPPTDEPAPASGAPPLGFIGTVSAYEALRRRFRLTLLTPKNRRAHMVAETFSAIVIEPALMDVTDDWRATFLGEPADGTDVDSLLRDCGARGIEVIGWMDCGAEEAQLNAPLLRRFDQVLCSTDELADALRAAGVDTRMVGVAAPDASRAPAGAGRCRGGPALRVAFTSLASAERDSELAQALASLTPFGLELLETEQEPSRESLLAMEALAPHIRGSLLPCQISSLFASIDVLLQVDAARETPAAARRQALQAALCGALVLVLGEPAATDPRRSFALFFDDISALRAFLSRLQGDELERDVLTHASWRAARALEDTSGPVPALRSAAGASDEYDALRLDMLSVLKGPAAAVPVLEDFRAQQCGGSALMLIGRGDRDGDWSKVEETLTDGERLLLLSSAHSASAALLTGSTRSSGDYLIIIPSDVRFGASMLSDLRLALAADTPAVAIKPAVYGVDLEGQLFRWSDTQTLPVPSAVAIRVDCVADLINPREDLDLALGQIGATAVRLGLRTITTDGLNAFRSLGDAAGGELQGWREAHTSLGRDDIVR